MALLNTMKNIGINNSHYEIFLPRAAHAYPVAPPTESNEWTRQPCDSCPLTPAMLV